MGYVSINVPCENRLACPQIIWMENKQMGFKPSPTEIGLGKDKNS
jgi:hypothetical protein